MGRAASRRRRGLSGGVGSNNTSSSTSSGNRGPRHGHGNKGKGGGGPSSNNSGLTISAAEKLYANQIAEGISLAQAMASNKAETIRFNDLVKDHDYGSTAISGSNNNNSTTNNDMALTKNQKTVQDLFGTHLGRQAGSEGLDYWAAELDSGKTVEDLVRGIQSGSEYKERVKASDAFSAANAGSTASDAYLDTKVTAGGGVYDDASGGFKFAADNTWSSPLMTSGNNTYTDELAKVYSDIGLTSGTTNTIAPTNTGNYEVGVTHDAVGNPINNNVTITPSTGSGDGPQPTVNPPVVTDPVVTDPVVTDPVVTDPASGGWWNDFADADAFKEFMQGGSSSSGSEFDQFLKFMTALQGMGGFGGGSGYGYGGYGGFAPGGVRPNVGMNNTMNALNAFKFLGSGEGGNVSTGLLSGLG